MVACSHLLHVACRRSRAREEQPRSQLPRAPSPSPSPPSLSLLTIAFIALTWASPTVAAVRFPDGALPNHRALKAELPNPVGAFGAAANAAGGNGGGGDGGGLAAWGLLPSAGWAAGGALSNLADGVPYRSPVCECMGLPRGAAANASSTGPGTAAAAATTANRPGLLPLLQQQQQQMQQSAGGGAAGGTTVGSAARCTEAVARVCRLAPGGPGCAALQERQEQVQQWQEQLGAGAVGGSGSAVWGDSPLRASPYLQALCPELASNGNPANATAPPPASAQPASGNSTNSTATTGSDSSSTPSQQQPPAPKFPCVCAYLGLASHECYAAVRSYCPHNGTGAPSVRRSSLQGGQGGDSAGVRAGDPTEGLGSAGWSGGRALRQQTEDSGPLCGEALPVLAAAYHARNGTGAGNTSMPGGVGKAASTPGDGGSVSGSLSGGQLRAVYGQLRDTCFPGAVSAPSYCNCGVDPYSANCALSLTSLCAAGDPLCRLTLEAWEGVGEGVGPEGSSSGSSSSTTTGGNRASAVLRAYFASACSSGSSGGEVGVGPSVPGAGAETAAGAGPLGAGQSGVIVRMELPGLTRSTFQQRGLAAPLAAAVADAAGVPAAAVVVYGTVELPPSLATQPTAVPTANASVPTPLVGGSNSSASSSSRSSPEGTTPQANASVPGVSGPANGADGVASNSSAAGAAGGSGNGVSGGPTAARRRARAVLQQQGAAAGNSTGGGPVPSLLVTLAVTAEDPLAAEARLEAALYDTAWEAGLAARMGLPYPPATATTETVVASALQPGGSGGGGGSNGAGAVTKPPPVTASDGPSSQPADQVTSPAPTSSPAAVVQPGSQDGANSGSQGGMGAGGANGATAGSSGSAPGSSGSSSSSSAGGPGAGAGRGAEAAAEGTKGSGGNGSVVVGAVVGVVVGGCVVAAVVAGALWARSRRLRRKRRLESSGFIELEGATGPAPEGGHPHADASVNRSSPYAAPHTPPPPSRSTGAAAYGVEYSTKVFKAMSPSARHGAHARPQLRVVELTVRSGINGGDNGAPAVAAPDGGFSFPALTPRASAGAGAGASGVVESEGSAGGSGDGASAPERGSGGGTSSGGGSGAAAATGAAANPSDAALGGPSEGEGGGGGAQTRRRVERDGAADKVLLGNGGGEDSNSWPRLQRRARFWAQYLTPGQGRQQQHGQHEQLQQQQRQVVQPPQLTVEQEAGVQQLPDSPVMGLRPPSPTPRRWAAGGSATSAPSAHVPQSLGPGVAASAPAHTNPAAAAAATDEAMPPLPPLRVAAVPAAAAAAAAPSLPRWDSGMSGASAASLVALPSTSPPGSGWRFFAGGGGGGGGGPR